MGNFFSHKNVHSTNNKDTKIINEKTNHIQIEKMLNEQFEMKTKADNEKIYKSWKTPYGFSIENHNLKILFYKCDIDLHNIGNSYPIGWLFPEDIKPILDQLRENPNKFKKNRK
jgi:hypothetical protein